MSSGLISRLQQGPSAADGLLDRLRRGVGPPVRVTELAEAIGCSRSYVHKLIEAGSIEAGRIGRDFRIPLIEAIRLAREAGALKG